MAKHEKDIRQQNEASKPPAKDEVAEQKGKAQQAEVAGRHKNDGQNDHQGNRRQPGSHK